MLVLIDVSGIDDLEETTPRLLNPAWACMGPTPSVVVEAVQSCCIIGSDQNWARSVLGPVAQVAARRDGGGRGRGHDGRLARQAGRGSVPCPHDLLPATAAAAGCSGRRIGAIMIDSPQPSHAAALRRAADVPVFESLTALHCCSAARRVSCCPRRRRAATRRWLTLA